jgi:hypothetical protein
MVFAGVADSLTKIKAWNKRAVQNEQSRIKLLLLVEFLKEKFPY